MYEFPLVEEIEILYNAFKNTDERSFNILTVQVSYLWVTVGHA